MNLPNIPYPKAARKQTQTVFGGLDRRAAAGNGAICSMQNLSSDDTPLISPRRARWVREESVGTPYGVFANGDTLFYVDGDKCLCCNGRPAIWASGEAPGGQTSGNVAELSATEKVFAALGARVLIWPDKLLAKQETDQTHGEHWALYQLEKAVSVSATFADGTYVGESAEGNTIKAADSSFDWADYFRVGDGVTISGAADAENNKTIIVREIEGDELRFYENSFTVTAAAETITVAREVPDLDFLCTVDNRVWGCKDDEIRCCKLGDPFNWSVFDGLSTDAWSVETGTADDFTGCVSFLGYPTFFKEERIFKVYGNRPSNFESMESHALGVLQGSHKSLAIADNTLYYLSRAGFVAYSAGIPRLIGEELEIPFINSAVGGSDGGKYWCSIVWHPDAERTASELLCYDPSLRVWHREDTTRAKFFTYSDDKLFCMPVNGKLMFWGKRYDGHSGSVELWDNDHEVYVKETEIESSAEFSDWDYLTFDSKYPVRLWIRCEVEGTLTVSIRYNDGEWIPVSTLGGGRGTVYLPVQVRRCDRYALKFEATGPWTLRALEWELSAWEHRRPIWQPKNLLSIAVTTMPTKTAYTVGETLDLTGCVVTATYSDGSTKDVTSLCTFSPADGDTLEEAGAVTVGVSYTEYGTTVTTALEVEATYPPYLTFSSEEPFTLGVYNSTKTWNGSLEYSTDKETWTTWYGSTMNAAEDGGKYYLYLRGTGNTRITGSPGSGLYPPANKRWVITGADVSCIGDIRTLLDYHSPSEAEIGEHCFDSMFYGCTSLTSAPAIIFTTMPPKCCWRMFYGCTSLATAPALPATILHDCCYNWMFCDCTSLATVPALPATSLPFACYSSMFLGCTSLKFSKVQSEDYQTAYRIPANGTGIAEEHSLDSMFSGTGGTFTGTPEINTTYYTSNAVVPAT